jgi:hypothetical protein
LEFIGFKYSNAPRLWNSWRNEVPIALVEKAATLRIGVGGPGGDHWDFPMTCPLANVDLFVKCQRIIDNQGGYSNGIGHVIECQEGYGVHNKDHKGVYTG